MANEEKPWRLPLEGDVRSHWEYLKGIIERAVLIEREIQAIGAEDVSPTAIAEALADEISGFVYNAPSARTTLGLDSEE